MKCLWSFVWTLFPSVWSTAGVGVKSEQQSVRKWSSDMPVVTNIALFGGKYSPIHFVNSFFCVIVFGATLEWQWCCCCWCCHDPSLTHVFFVCCPESTVILFVAFFSMQWSLCWVATAFKKSALKNCHHLLPVFTMQLLNQAPLHAHFFNFSTFSTPFTASLPSPNPGARSNFFVNPGSQVWTHSVCESTRSVHEALRS